eukprot:TRINITY_DN32110_c0_g1_i1.p1 TRINITY_DN32110_c0_g1~~TRINITY_DN32110_c0_g1_i1.p1  ORF type:complete len:651 (-),score=91.63 TRINITY_DN32110_c0_g1_i1:209-2161(-)
MSQGPWPQPTIEAPLFTILERAGGRAFGTGPGASGHRIAEKFSERLARQLLLASQTGDSGSVWAALGQGAEPNSRVAVTEASALHLACACGDKETVRMLLDAGAMPDALDAQKRTPLDAAIAGGSAEAAATILLRRPESVLVSLEDDSTRWFGAVMTLLETAPAPASSSRHAGRPYSQVNEERLDAVVRLLHDMHKPREPPGSVCKTAEARCALFACVVHGYVGGAVALLRSGAVPVDYADPKSRRTALDLARALQEAQTSPDEPEMCLLLRAHGAKEPFNPFFPEWALLLASSRGDERAVRYWLPQVKNVDYREPPPADQHEDGQQCTALMFAAIEGHENIVRILVAAGARSNLRDASGRNAGELARQRGHMHLAYLLGAHGELGSNDAHLNADALMPPIPWREPPGWREVPEIDERVKGEAPKMQMPEHWTPHRLLVRCERVRGLATNFFQLSCDPCVNIALTRVMKGRKLVLQEAKTDIGEGTEATFNQSFEFFSIFGDETLEMSVLDEDLTGVSDAEFMGRVDTKIEKLQKRLLQRETVTLDKMLNFQVGGAQTGYITFSLKIVDGDAPVSGTLAKNVEMNESMLATATSSPPSPASVTTRATPRENRGNGGGSSFGGSDRDTSLSPQPQQRGSGLPPPSGSAGFF